MFINRKQIRAQMYARNISIDEIVSKLKMSRGTFYKKMSGISEFKESEIEVLHDNLGAKVFLPQDFDSEN